MILPTDLKTAAHLIQEHCKGIKDCNKCVFNVHDDFHSCILFELNPSHWQLEKVDKNCKDANDKIQFEGRTINA